MNEHFCQEHNTKFYKNEKTREDGSLSVWYSHKLPEGGYCNESKKKPQPVSEYTHQPSSSASKEVREKVGDPDWDAIAKGKTRCAVVVALIEHGGLEALAGQFDRINRVVDFVISGQPPEVS